MRKQVVPKFTRRTLMAAGPTIVAGGTLGSLPAAANDTEVSQIEEPTGVVWRYDGPYDTAVATGGQIYVRADGDIVALDADDGSVEWELDDIGAGGPSVEDGTVFAGDPVRAIDAETGEGRWESEISSGWFVVSHGMVYTSSDGTLYALDGEDGSIQWERESVTIEIGEREQTATDLSLGDIGDRALYTYDSNLIIGLDPITGETEVTMAFGGESGPSIGSIDAAGSGHVAYRGEDMMTEGSLVTVPTESHSTVERSEVMGNPETFGHTIIGDIYFNSGDAGFGAYDLSDDPEHIWGYRTPVTVGTGLPEVIGDTAVATHVAGPETMGDQDEDRVMAFDLERGEEQWRYTFEETEGLDLVNADENTVYVYRNEELLALRTEQEPEEEEASIQAEIIEFNPAGGTVTPGEEMTSTVTVENTGDTDHSFFVGYNVIGPDDESYYDEGETGTTVTLGPGEQTTVDVHWTATASAPTGTYDALTVLWEESDRDTLATRLDEAEESAAFELQEASIQAEIVEFTSSGGTVTPGDEMTSTVTVENTGETDQTFFVGYSVIAPDGSEFHNASETGTAVTLEVGERTTIELTWVVTPAAPSGTYNAYTVVWEESDRSELETQLDAVTDPEAFEVNGGTDGDERFTPSLHGFGFPNWVGEEGCSTDSDSCPDDEQFSVPIDPVGDIVTIERVRQTVETWPGIDHTAVSPLILAHIIHSLIISRTISVGHCYGMVFTADDYFREPSQLPGDLETASEIPYPSDDYADVGEKIREAHITQRLNSDVFWYLNLAFQFGWVDYEGARDDLMTAIDENGTAGVALCDSDSNRGHQVLAYHYEEMNDTVEFFLYDPEYSARSYQTQGNQYETPFTSLVVDAGTGKVAEEYSYIYDQYAHIDPDLTPDSVDALASSVEDLLASLTDAAVFQLNSPASLTVDAPESSTVVQPEAEFEHAETLSDFAYVADAEPADYEVTVSGEDDGDYTLDMFVAQDGEIVLEETVSDSITDDEDHGFTVSVQATADESSIQRADTMQETDGDESNTEFPTWFPIVGGATGLTAVAVGAYTYLSQKEGEEEEKQAEEEDHSRPESAGEDRMEPTPPREHTSIEDSVSDEQSVPSRAEGRHNSDGECPHCGTIFLDDAQFCHECGRTLNQRQGGDHDER